MGPDPLVKVHTPRHIRARPPPTLPVSFLVFIRRISLTVITAQTAAKKNPSSQCQPGKAGRRGKFSLNSYPRTLVDPAAVHDRSRAPDLGSPEKASGGKGTFLPGALCYIYPSLIIVIAGDTSAPGNVLPPRKTGHWAGKLFFLHTINFLELH